MSVMLDNQIVTYESGNQIESLVTYAPTIAIEETGQAASKIFADDLGVEGIVVLENRHPVGIIMRMSFYQKFGTQYGHSLYTSRSVKLLMDTTFMWADINDTISKISTQAMSRQQDKLYDFIVVFKSRAYYGVISLRHFLVELSKRNEAQISILKDQQKKLLNAHEQEVRLRKDIEYRSTSLKNLMDNADQGFLSFGRDLSVREEPSYKCMEIFQKNIAGLNFIDLVKKFFEEDKKAVFHMIFDSYFGNNSQVTDQVYLMLLPADCVIGNRNVHLDYRKIEIHGQKAVMVIMNDVTEKIKLEKAIADDQNKQRLIIKAFSYQSEIKRSLRDFRDTVNGGYLEYFPSGGRFDDGLNALYRVMHTYKGDFAQFGFLIASQLLHATEDKLGKLNGQCGDVRQVMDIMSSVDVDEVFREDLEIISDVLGKGYFEQGDMISVSKERLSVIKSLIMDGSIPMEKNALVGLLASFEHKEIKTYLNRYSDYIEYLSERLMKNKPVFIIEGDDVEIDEESYAGFYKSLVHVFRNIMDHAIEDAEERVGLGKPETGLIACRISAINDSLFQLSISDDGRGLDLEKIAAKAVQNQICTAEQIDDMTADEIAHLIFSDGLSTKDSADDISGRGVGMAAVWQSCTALGGKIGISTKAGQGTVFTFTLPYTIVF